MRLKIAIGIAAAASVAIGFSCKHQDGASSTRAVDASTASNPGGATPDERMLVSNGSLLTIDCTGQSCNIVNQIALKDFQANLTSQIQQTLGTASLTSAQTSSVTQLLAAFNPSLPYNAATGLDLMPLGPSAFQLPEILTKAQNKPGAAPTLLQIRTPATYTQIMTVTIPAGTGQLAVPLPIDVVPSANPFIAATSASCTAVSSQTIGQQDQQPGHFVLLSFQAPAQDCPTRLIFSVPLNAPAQAPALSASNSAENSAITALLASKNAGATGSQNGLSLDGQTIVYVNGVAYVAVPVSQPSQSQFQPRPSQQTNFTNPGLDIYGNPLGTLYSQSTQPVTAQVTDTMLRPSTSQVTDTMLQRPDTPQVSDTTLARPQSSNNYPQVTDTTLPARTGAAYGGYCDQNSDCACGACNVGIHQCPC